MSPYFALFGQNMFTNSNVYKLTRKFKAFEVPVTKINRNDKLESIRNKVKENLHRPYEVSAKRYNIRAKELHFNLYVNRKKTYVRQQ